MAVMGVRINQPGGGLRIDASVGDLLAKGIWGDPEREMKLALSRSDLETDEYNRRQIEANTNWIRARQATEDFELSGRKGQVPVIADILMREQALPTTAAPAIVEPQPVTTPAPVVAEPAPAIVETPEPEQPSPAPAAAEEAPVPSILRLPEEAPVEVDEVPTLEQAPVTGGMVDANWLLGQRPGSDYYEDLEGMPVVVDDQADQSIVSPPTEPEPAPTTPAPAATVAQPSTDTPPAVPATSGEVPTPELPDNAPTPQPRPLVEETPDGGTRIDTPAGPVVLTREQAEALAHGIVANKGDVAGQTAKFGGQLALIRDPTLTPTQKLAILFTGEVPSQSSILGPGGQATGKVTVIEGETWTEFVGADGKPYMVRTPGGPVKPAKPGEVVVIDDVPFTKQVQPDGTTVLVPTPGGPKPKEPGLITATGIEGDYQRAIEIVKEKVRTNQPVTPKEASFYDAAVTELYEGKYDIRSGPDGAIMGVMIDPANPLILPSKADVYRRAGIKPPAQPAKQPAQAGTTTDAQGNTVTTTTAEAEGGATATTTTTTPNELAVPEGVEDYDFDYEGGSGKIKMLVPGRVKMTEKQTTSTGYYIISSKANPKLDALRAKSSAIPGPTEAYIGDPSAQELWRKIGAGYFTRPEVQQYYVNAMNFANAIMRQESGAATRPEELGIIFTRFIPQWQDTDEIVELKRQYRLAAIEGLKHGMLGEKPTAAEIEAYAVGKVGKDFTPKIELTDEELDAEIQRMEAEGKK